MKFYLILTLLIGARLTVVGQHQEVETNLNEHEKNNMFGLFAGHTIIAESGFQLPTVGIEYVREVNPWLGLGIATELEIGSHIIQTNEDGVVVSEVERESTILILPSVFIKVYKGLNFMAGYGIEFEKNENLALAKFGIEYKLKMHNPNWVVLPQASWDHTKLFDGVVYGITFGYEF